MSDKKTGGARKTYSTGVLDERWLVLQHEHKIVADLRQLKRNIANTASNIDNDTVLREMRPVVRCVSHQRLFLPRKIHKLPTKQRTRDLHLGTAHHGGAVALEREKVLRAVEVLEAGTLEADRALEARLRGLLGPRRLRVCERVGKEGACLEAVFRTEKCAQISACERNRKNKARTRAKQTQRHH